nr:chemotaxis protein [Escherichia coli]
ASTAAVSLEEQAARLAEAVDVFRLNKHSVSAEPRGAGEPVSFATV